MKSGRLKNVQNNKPIYFPYLDNWAHKLHCQFEFKFPRFSGLHEHIWWGDELYLNYENFSIDYMEWAMDKIKSV